MSDKLLDYEDEDVKNEVLELFSWLESYSSTIDSAPNFLVIDNFFFIIFLIFFSGSFSSPRFFP